MSEGCANCYAETFSRRNPEVLGVWGNKGTRVIAADNQWKEPLKWDRMAREGTCYVCRGNTPLVGNPPRCWFCGYGGHLAPYRARVFCASLADVFEGPETMPEPDRFHGSELWDARQRLFRLIDETPSLDWLLLTKRPNYIKSIYRDYLDGFDGRKHYSANMWLGATAENQKRLDERAPYLCELADKVRVRFLSCEPLLGPVDLRKWLDPARGINWVIVGGESGSGAREFNTDWARVIVDQCGDAGVPCFVKQMGSNALGLDLKGKGEDLESIPPDLRVRQHPEPEMDYGR